MKTLRNDACFVAPFLRQQSACHLGAGGADSSVSLPVARALPPDMPLRTSTRAGIFAHQMGAQGPAPPISPKNGANAATQEAQAFAGTVREIAGQDFCGLISVLHVGVPARVEALLLLIARGEILPEQFFASDADDMASGNSTDQLREKSRDEDLDRRCLIDHVLEDYGTSQRADLSPYLEGILEQQPGIPGRPEATEIDHLRADIQRFSALLVACRSREAHPRIRDAVAGHQYELYAACVFIRRAGLLAPERRRDRMRIPLGPVEPLIATLLAKLDKAAGNLGADEPRPDTETLAEVLASTAEGTPHAMMTAQCHWYGTQVIKRLPPSPKRTEISGLLLCGIAKLPLDSQLQAFMRHVDFISGSPRRAFMHDRGKADCLMKCAQSLGDLSDDVMYAAARHLLARLDPVDRRKAERQFVDVVLSTDERTGERRFAKLRLEDRQAVFWMSMDSAGSRSERWARAKATLDELPEDFRERAHQYLRVALAPEAD